MPSYNTQRAISTYTIDKSLVLKIEDYFKKDVLEILNINSEEFKKTSRDILSVTIHDSYGQEVYSSIEEYKHSLFRNDTKGFSIKFTLKNPLHELKIILRFGKEQENSDLSITLSDNKPREKAKAIEDGLVTILNHHKNLNWLLYPKEQIVAALIGFGCFLAGMASLGDRFTNREKFILGTIFWVGVFYFFVCRYFKGYCTFETNKQKQLDKWFSWLNWGTLGFLLFTTLLGSVRKNLFGF